MTYAKVFLTILYISITSTCYAWEYQSLNFLPQTYSGGPQNWQTKQSENGLLYFANNHGLLEFDGLNWEIYPMQDKIVRSIEIYGDTILAGGNNMFGYYSKDSKGIFDFNSLKKHVGKDWKGDIWNIYKIDKQIYYIDDHNIYVFDDNFKYQATFHTKFKIDCTMLQGKNIYIGGGDNILYFNTKKETFESTPFKNITKLHSAKIVELLNYKNNLIIVTSSSGIYQTEGNEIRNLLTLDNKFIAENQLFCANIQDDILAIGSVQDGILLFDLKHSNSLKEINQKTSLNNNTILGLFFDKDKNLWVNLDYGISYIGLNNNIRNLFSKESTIGTGYCSKKFNETIYLGTNQGLYTIDSKDNITLIQEAKGQIIDLIIHQNTLFSCGDNNLFIVDNKKKYTIDQKGILGVYPIKNRNDELIVASYFGLKLLKYAGDRWYISHDIEGLNIACKGLTHHQGLEYWQANPGDQFVNKLIFDDSIRQVKVIKYDLGEVVIAKNSKINIIDGNATICTEKGLYKYSLENDNFIPYQELEAILSGDQVYNSLDLDEYNNMWYITNNVLYFLPFTNNRIDFLKYPITVKYQIMDGNENITMIDSIRAIIGTYKGFSLVNTQMIKQEYNTNKLSIRWLKTTQNDQNIIYAKTESPIILNYENNIISLIWGSGNPTMLDKMEYNYKLVGLDDKWITTNMNQKEYTNLSEGKYIFEIRVLSLDKSTVLSSDSISFEILAPWYRSKYAYIIYLICLVIVLLIAHKIATNKQKKKMAEKERYIAYQELLLQEEIRLKNEKTLELEKEKLKSDLEYKNYESSGYILNLSRKNEIFEKIKKEASKILKLIDNKNYNIIAIRKGISDLIKDVNNNVKNDDDFEAFTSNFNFVHKDFFEILQKEYPLLTQKDKTLCAYIKMNLASKEIAPLLNISVRGVEINRYNLRKKMELDRTVNLTEHLNNLK